MLIKAKWIVLVCAASWLIVPEVQANATRDARRSITKAYKQMDAATARKDSQAILSFIAADYKFTIGEKTWPRSHFVSDAHHLFSVAKTLRAQTSIKKFVLKRGKAIVMAQEIAYVTAITTRAHKVETLRTDSIFKDVWVKRQGRWLKQKTTNFQFKVTANGKPVKTAFGK